MRTRNGPGRGGLGRSGWLMAVAVAALWAGSGRAAEPPALAPMGGKVVNAAVAPLSSDTAASTLGIVQTSGTCASCSGGSPMPAGPGVWGAGKHHPVLGDIGCSSCGGGSEGCGENGCVPGRQACETCEGHHRVGRLFCAFHNALCCPDPCYEPRWSCGPNAALFVDYARPVTQTRLRWDSGHNMTTPDRAAYFFQLSNRGGPAFNNTVDYDQLTLYQEVAADKFSFYIAMPYRTVNGDVTGGSGGFGDMRLGTKSMLLDSELVQLTFQFQTTIPMGVANRGLGNGHVALTPSLLTAIKLYPDTYYQGQFGYWIPISAPGSGGVFEFNQSINHVLCRPLSDTVLVGSIETMGWNFTAGQVTPGAGLQPVSANNTTYFSAGPGVRLCICDKIDFGFGVQFAVTSNHFADQLYRTEMRWRF